MQYNNNAPELKQKQKQQQQGDYMYFSMII
jgi:hypothetical protein